MAILDFFKNKKADNSQKLKKEPNTAKEKENIAVDPKKQSIDKTDISEQEKNIPSDDDKFNYSYGPQTIILPSKEDKEEVSSKKGYFKSIKLCVFLIENTQKAEKERLKISQIFKKFVDSKFIIINYGSEVRRSTLKEKTDFYNEKFFIDEDLGDNVCLNDALIELENVIEEYYLKNNKDGDYNLFVNSIDIIGIGTGADNFSSVSDKLAMESFARVEKFDKITTRYFCIDEQYVINAAGIGFRSIGTIPKSKI